MTDSTPTTQPNGIKPADPKNHIGTLLKNLPVLHEKKFEVGYGMHAPTIFQKLISKELIEHAIWLKSDDFYRSLVFLDYYCEVFDPSYDVCDKMNELSDKLQTLEKQKNISTGKLSHLPLVYVIYELGLYEKATKNHDFSDPATLQEITDRYKKADIQQDFKSPDLRKGEPFYDAIGHMIADFVTDEKKYALLNVASRMQLLALVFVDSIIQYVSAIEHKKDIDDALVKKNYLTASILALQGLSKVATFDKLVDVVDTDYQKAKSGR